MMPSRAGFGSNETATPMAAPSSTSAEKQPVVRSVWLQPDPQKQPAVWRNVLAHLLALLIALALAACTFVFRFNTLGGTVVFDNDEFATLTRVDLLLRGEQVLRDFADGELRAAWPSLTYEVPAWVLRRWDHGLLSYAYLTFGMLAFCTAAVFLLARAMSGRWLVPLLGAVVVLLSQPNSYNYPKVLTVTMGAAAIWWALQRPTIVPLLTLAACTVVAGLFRHDGAVYVGLGAVVGLVARDVPRWRAGARRVATYAGLTALLSVPSLVWVERYEGIAQYLQSVLASSRTEADTRALRDWPILDPAAPFDAESLVALNYYAFWTIPLVAAVFLVRGRGSGRREGAADWAFGLALVAMALVVNQFFLRANLLARFGDAVVPVVLVASWLAASAPAFRSSVTRAVAAAFPPLALAMMCVAFAVAAEVPRQLEVAGMSQSLEATGVVFESVRARLRSLPPMEWPVKETQGTLAVSRYLAECTGPEDRVLMAVYADEIPYFARRLFAGGQGYFHHGFLRSDADQRLALERLSRQSVPVVVVAYGHEREFAADYPLVAAHVAARYREAGVVSSDGEPLLRVLAEARRQPSGTDPVLGFPCFR
jgi:hypothetical protein